MNQSRKWESWHQPAAEPSYNSSVLNCDLFSAPMFIRCGCLYNSFHGCVYIIYRVLYTIVFSCCVYIYIYDIQYIYIVLYTIVFSCCIYLYDIQSIYIYIMAVYAIRLYLYYRHYMFIHTYIYIYIYHNIFRTPRPWARLLADPTHGRAWCSENHV